MGKGIRGLLGGKGGDAEFAKAQKAFSKAQALSDEAIARQKSYLESWEASFGSIEKNIAEYVNQLNPNVVASRQLATFEEAFSQQVTDIKTNFAQRFGAEVTGSGLQKAGLLNAQLDAAKIRAQVKAASEQQVFQQQLQTYGATAGVRESARKGLNQAFQHASGTNLKVGQQQVAIGKHKDQRQLENVELFARAVTAAATGGKSEVLRSVTGGGGKGGGIDLGSLPGFELPDFLKFSQESPAYTGPITGADMEG